MPSPGKVSLVGAGPGDPGLITVKGLKIIQESEVVIYDRLANPELLINASPKAELIDVGKTPGRTRLRQPEINDLIVQKALEGKSVCRLKGGDPFVFGRGGEEALALVEAGIPWEVVPGVTSAVAAAAYAGIPVTHRGLATSVTFITGSEDPEKPDSQINFESLARMTGTIVFMMGWSALPEITSQLIHAGMSPDRPASIIQWGTWSRQRAVTGPLSDIAAIATAAGLSSPVAFVIGEVTELRSSLRWFDNQPLFGKKVLVTRTRSQASRFRTLLEEQGANCVEFPLISIVPLEETTELDAALSNISSYDWIVFSSSNGVRGVSERMSHLGVDSRAFAGVQVAAVGPATGVTVRELFGISSDLVPDEYVSEAVVKALADLGISGKRILAIRSDLGRDTLENGLRDSGASVDAVVGYQTLAPEDSAAKAREAFESGIDVTTFTSSSGVDNLLNLLGGETDLINATTVGCMGPITAERARERGLNVNVVASERTMESFTQALVDHFYQ
ncbi:MAG: uroporphyrinogen-III C-methyltransferase [Chloroflexi bacterium]|nr:uroporphyrinogen-III C-methyltransferase [Chloroflexota bacterium]